jgi:hypothetical protein
MPHIDADSSDDDIYDWFIQSLAAEFGSADEVAPNVIKVVEVAEDDEPDIVLDPRPFELHISRQQLRSVAWTDVNIFDDSQGEVSVPSTNPVFDGLDAYSFYTCETMASGGRFSRYYVFDGYGGMRRSVRPDDAPPI